MEQEERKIQLDALRREKIRRIIANNFEELAHAAGWPKVSRIMPFERYGKDDRMEIQRIYHHDGSLTIVAYMCDEIENDVNALNSYINTLEMFRKEMKRITRPVRNVVIGLDVSDDLIEEFKEMRFPFALWVIKGKEAAFYPSRIGDTSKLCDYVEIQ